MSTLIEIPYTKLPITLTEKMLDVRYDNRQYLLLEGVTGGSKTTAEMDYAWNKIFFAPKHQVEFRGMAESIYAAKVKFIYEGISFFQQHREFCTFHHGENYIKILTPTGYKFFRLYGYTDKNAWTKALGQNVDGYVIDEINLAHNDFVSEIFGRGISRNSWVICTTNGADPESKFYETMNAGRPLKKWLHQIPKTTLEYINAVPEDKHIGYYFFNFDDNPSMEEETKQRMYNLPRDYYYTSKVLGERGVREGLIYIEHMNKKRNIKEYDEIIKKCVKFTIGIDVGGTDYTVFTLNGFTNRFEHHVVLDYAKIRNAGFDEIWTKFAEFFNPIFDKYRRRLVGAFIDKSAKIMKTSFNAKMLKAYSLQCVGYYNITKSIQGRIDSEIPFLQDGRILFTERTLDIYEAFTKATYTKDKTRTDPRVFTNHDWKDYIDSTEYGQSPFTASMLKFNKVIVRR